MKSTQDGKGISQMLCRLAEQEGLKYCSLLAPSSSSGCLQRLLAQAQCSELARNFLTGWMENADFEKIEMFCGEYVDFSSFFFVMESRHLSQVILPGVTTCVRLSWDLGAQGAQALLSLVKHQGLVLTG